MAYMVLLKCNNQSKVATVLCPECGRISYRALAAPYTPNGPAKLKQPYGCPVCNTEYEYCDPEQAEKWEAAYLSYQVNAGGYIQSVKNKYIRNKFQKSKEKYKQSVKKSADHKSDDPVRPVSQQIDPLSGSYRTNTVPGNNSSGLNANLERKTDHWKRELLDTGKRNKMINYRETKRATLKILAPEASELFNRLAFSEKPLTFQKPINKDTDLRTYSMIALMETLSYTLNVQVGDIKTAGTIVDREKTLKNLRSKAKLAQEEQGINILYLCFGFIYWREHDRENSQWLKSPLLMMPVSLGLKSLNAPFALSRYDDEIEVNPTLDYLFNTEYRISLPPFDLKNKSSFDEYFEQIDQIVDRRGWKVTREVSLGLLSFLKIGMYHDLNGHRDLIVNHPVLRAMGGDRSALGELPPQAEHFDFDSVKPDEWHEVVNSDSSQEEAILLSKLGVSFVMQGPPGTGKSQTITNIIAEALADGKKILFVSEKAAALQVVLKRLTEVHLDDFCLSLHSHKANKKEVIDSIGANLDLKEEYIDNSAYRKLTELSHDRDFLNTYAGELHKKIAPLNQSVYMVFGRIFKLEKATPLEFSLDRLTEISQEQYDSVLYYVGAFEKALHGMEGRLSENPWYGTRAASSGQAYKIEFLSNTENLSHSLRKIAVLADKIDSGLGSGMTESFSQVKSLLGIADALIVRPAYICRKWFDPGVSARGKTALSEAEAHSRKLHQYRETVHANWDSSIFSFDPESIREHFFGEYSWLYDSAGSNVIGECLANEKAGAEDLKGRIDEILVTYHKVLDFLSYSQGDSPENIRMIFRVLNMIADAPYMEAAWFDARKNAESVPLIREAMAHSALIRSLTEEILRDWEPSAFSIDAEGMLSRFKMEYVGLFHTLKYGYKEDIRMLRLHAKSVGGKFDEASVVDFLQKLKNLNAEKAWLDEKNEELNAALGSQYRRENTEWSRIPESMAKALEIVKEFPYSAIPNETIEAMIWISRNMQLLGEVRQIAEKLSDEKIDRIETDIRNSRYINCYTSDSDLSEAVLPQIDSFIKNCDIQKEHAVRLAEAKKNGALTCEDISALLPRLTVIKEETAWFEEHKDTYAELFGEAYQKDECDWTAILNGYETVERIAALFGKSVPESVIDIACSRTADPSLEADISELADLVRETDPKLAAFSAQFEEDDFAFRSMHSVADHYDQCADGFVELNKWLDYAEARKECDKRGLADFTAKIAERDNTVADVQKAFERGFYIQWLLLQLDHVPAVQAFRRRIHEQRFGQFVELDVKQYEIARKTIRKRIISTYPDLNKIARAGSELAILRHEMDKKRRIMPLRRLFQSIPTLLLTLKPCLMMSPLSVAYFLDAQKYQFDMVIFDEASQIFPQDAVGAIFRAKQVIIAGDTKQLPPTNFFAANTSNINEEYDDDDSYDEVYDSILEETAYVLPNRTLRWHYRSRHEHLIAFSNQEIYKNNLVTFPSSNESDPDTGVEFVYVEDGFYEPSPRNNNILEAKRIVELVKEHIEKYPQRSLGVIAFSEKQQQTILLEIQRFREKHSEYEAFFAEDKEDEFFVKNLENVQGDERDTIFFSIGYAKTRDQKASGRPMTMRFGPLGTSGGERRLNVAITRAKINVKLVSSILPSDIDLSRTESEGIRMLRSYIEFAMNGEATLASAHRNSRPDEFADFIAQYIRDHGFKVQQNVGCSGYRIDIAVEYPSDTVRQFVAGIECDGFSYAAARTARDRDRLRSTVLKNMGWNLYRIWSAEWYRNPEIEGKNLILFLTRAVSSYEKKIRELEEKKRREEEEKRRALEKARAEREAEERRKQRAREEREAKFRAEREESERRRREAEEKKSARLKAKKEAAWRKIQEQRRREAEAGTPKWVAVGAAVSHKVFGNGVIEAIEGRIVSVRFESGVKRFVYPKVFTEGYLTKRSLPEESSAEMDHTVGYRTRR